MGYVDRIDSFFPKQRINYKEKIADDKAWAKKVIDLLLMSDTADGFISEEGRYNKMLSNYQLYNNIINQTEFERDCNPLGIEVGQLKDEIKPYNKTPNKINALLGEEYSRPFNYRTVLVNAEGIKSKQEHKKKLLMDFVNSYTMDILSKINPMIGKQNPETGEIIKPEHLDDYINYSYQDSREALANKILDYIVRKEFVIDKKNDGFKHGLLSGEEHAWVGIENNEPVVQVLNTLGTFYHKSPDVKFIEDGLYAGYRTRMNIGDIIDKFGQYLKEDDLLKLEGTMHGYSSSDYSLHKDMRYGHTLSSDPNNLLGNTIDEGSYNKAKSEDWVVYHVEWKSQKKVGFLKFQNNFGEEEMIMVSEDFEVPSYATKSKIEYKGHKKDLYIFDDMSLEWAWIPEVWEGIRIGDGIYCCIGPKEYQYRSIDNPFKVKLGYHGVVYSNMNSESISLMERMKPFQFLYFIISHKLKRLIARDKGQIFHFDLSMVPESIGLEKTIYYLEEMDIDFFDPLQNAENPGAYQRGKITGATSRSNMQHIAGYIQLLAYVDEQINDAAGITRQREGQTQANEAVTNAQQNLIRSSTVTEAVYFKPHDLLWENILNSVVQCAQTAWSGKSIIKQYVLDDLSIQTLEVPSESLVNSDIGVFVSNSTKDTDVFHQLKGLAQPLLQNDKARFTDIIKLLKSDSIRDLEMTIMKSEKRLQQEQLEQIRAQQESQQAAQQMAFQAKQMDIEATKQLQAQKDAAAMERELVKSFSWNEDKDINDNLVPDVLEVEKFREELKFKREELQQEKEENRKERESKEKLARINATKSSSPKKN